MGVVLSQKKGNLIDYYKLHARVNFCNFCSFLSDDHKLADICNLDHQKRGLDPNLGRTLQICHAGLFNYSFPIEINGEIVASILVGQNKIKGKGEESLKKFEEFLKTNSFPEKKVEKLISFFDQVPVVELNTLQNKIDEFLPFTHKIVKLLLEQEEANRARNTHAVHEILLPMQSIINSAENLKEETYSKNTNFPLLRDLVSRILFEVINLNITANNLRKINQPFIASDYELKSYPIYPLIEEARNRFTFDANEKEILLKPSSYTGGEYPKLFIEKEEIKAALNNLYSNAIKYSYFGKKDSKNETIITTECSDEIINNKNHFVIAISNKGVGILQDEIDSKKIFRPGYRGKLSSDRNRTGSGVGLFLTQEIIERIHKGKIEVTSVEIYNSYLTTVKIKLPY